MISEQTHKLLPILELRESHELRVTFLDGRAFLLKMVCPIDSSIYNSIGGWTADVVCMLSDPKNKFHKPRSGLDFFEGDILEIQDLTSEEVIYGGVRS